MSQRIKVSALIAPAGIYQREAIEAHGYAPSEQARFAVVRTDAKSPWRLVHLASGATLDSIFPARSRVWTMAEKLAVAEMWHAATHLDWSAFDALPVVSCETRDAPSLDIRRQSQRDALAEMRTLASRACQPAEA